MASFTLQEALGHVDEIAKELSFYDGGIYKQIQEQTIINKCKDTVEKVRAAIMAKEPDGTIRADKLSSGDWRRIASLIPPLARCFTATTPSPVAPTAKTRHASATAVASLALLSSCNQKSKLVVASALENGVVDAFVATLRNSLRNPVSDRVIKAMLYKLIEALWGFTLYATSQHQQDMVARDVVNVCIDLVTAPSVETESKLNASKTLYNCLVADGRAVTELRTSKVQALNNQLQQLAQQIPDPVTAAGLVVGGSSAAKAISMPVMLPAFMSWIWFLPHYILDHLMDTLSRTLSRIVVLVWPEGAPGIPLLEQGREEPIAGPLQVAQLSLPNRSLRNTLQNLFRSIASGIADPRLVGILRGARLPAAVDAGADADADAEQAAAAARGTGLPARLVRVVREGRPDGMETKVALELLDELFACDANGDHPELADDAVAAGLLASMTELGVLEAIRTEAGLAGVVAFVRLALKLAKRAPYTPGLSGRLHDSGVPASVAYLAFLPSIKISLRLEALQTLREMVQLDTAMTEHVVAMNNFPIALTNTLLGGDPDTARKPPVRPQAKRSGSGSSKKKGSAAAAVAELPGPNPASRNHRDQMQEAAFDILTVVLDVARESDKVWETVVQSGMLSRLVQHSCAFPMQPSLLAELLLAVGLTFKDHREDTATVGDVQAACAPHTLPLLLHEEPVVAGAAARVLKDILLDMQRYRADVTDVEEGDKILRALVAAGAAINNADAAVARATAAAVATVVAEADAAAVMDSAATVAMAVTANGAAAGVAGPGPSSVKAEPGGAGGGAATGPTEAPLAPAVSVEEEVQRSAVQGCVAMEVDVPSTSAAAAPDGGAAAVAAANVMEPTDAAASPPGAGDAAAAAVAAPESELSELVDVTAYGLGLMCAAMQSCIATVLQRPRGGKTPTASPPLAAAAASAAVTVLSTASSPLPSRVVGGGGAAAAATSTAGPSAIVLDGPAYESLEALLLSCRLLGEACLQMPTHGSVRRHLARAFAYAKPAAEELEAALEELAEPDQGHQLLLADTREVLTVLQQIPVLDTALLPKPKMDEEEEAKDAPLAPAANGVPKKGRPPGSGKRSSQGNLGTDGAPQLAQQPSKRQRTASTAAAAAAAVAAAAAAADDGTPGAIARTRSSNLANAEYGVTGSPRLAARASAAAAAAAAAADASASAAAGPADATAATAPPPPGAGLSESRNGGDAQMPPGSRRLVGLPPLPARGHPAAAGTSVSGSGDGAGVLARSGSEISGAGAAVAAVPAGPAAPPAVGGAVGLGLPLPHPVRAPAPNPAAPWPGALAESPSVSLDKGGNSQGAPGSATAAGGAAAGDGGAPKGRVNAAEFRARYLDMKAQNARMTTELEQLRREKNEAVEQQRKTADLLSSRTEELTQSLQELEEKDAELAKRSKDIEALKQQLQAARVELEAAKEVAAEAQAAVAGATAGLRELEQLRSENAELKAELATLADLE